MGLMDAAGAAIGTIGGMLNAGAQDDRQVRQQEKLNALGVKSSKELGDYQYNQQKRMWDETNYEAQVEHAKKAGLSVGLLMGKGGGGGATVSGSVPNVSGGQAANAAATTQASAVPAQMGLMMAQIANTLADTAKKNAEKPNIEANTEATKTGIELTSEKVTGERFQNAVNEILTAQEKARSTDLDNQIKAIESTRAGAEWEAYLASGWKGKELNDPESPMAKALSAGFEKTVQELENAKKDGSIKAATAAIEGFKARLAENGLAPDTPWYGKLLSDIASKLNMNPLEWIKKK